ncbi:MAG: TRAP transporter substrate-binding protein, partial [Lachnospiraceae bacterium]|nr:TRAP transporter substrate-binding protein [Candidatus Minthocola equi]
LTGMALRTMNNKHHMAFWGAMGALPTPLDTADIFLALQQGMIEGQENPYGQIVDKKMYEVQKYVTNTNHIFYIGDVFMSKMTFDSLNEVEQQIICDAATEVKALAMDFVDKTTDEALKKLTSELGMTMIDIDAIPGMRDAMANATHDAAYNSIKEAIGNELLDKWIAAAEAASK